MLMPSATMGCASAAALPTAKMPSRPKVRMPVRSGPEDNQAPSSVADASASATPVHDDSICARTASPARTSRPLSPAAIELVAANAARQADATAIGVHHAAIAAREGEQRHQVRGQRAVAKMGLEAEQIRGARRPAQVLRRHRAGLPGAVRGNDQPRPQDAGLPRALVDDGALVATVVVDELPRARTAATPSAPAAAARWSSSVSRCSRPTARPPLLRPAGGRRQRRASPSRRRRRRRRGAPAVRRFPATDRQRPTAATAARSFRK